MSKLTDLKAKLNDTLAKVKTKLDSIAFLQKFRTKSDKPTNPNSFFNILAHGSFGERLQAYFSLLLMLIGITLGSFAIGKIIVRFSKSAALKEQDARYAKGFDQMQDRAKLSASVVSLGKVMINGYGIQHKNILSLDLWARCDSPESAAFAETNFAKMNDKAIQVLTELSVQNENIMDEMTKEKAKTKMRDAMNTIMLHGKVEDVFFHNLIIE